MTKMKKTYYIKPKVHVHWLIVESDLLTLTSDDTEIDDSAEDNMGAKRYDPIIEDDEDEGYY